MGAKIVAKQKAALIVVHGMGETPRNFDEALRVEVKRRLGNLCDELHIGKVYYQSILQSNETRVWKRVEKRLTGEWYSIRRLWWNDLRKFVLYGFGDAAGLESGKEGLGSVYTQAQILFAREMLAACRAIGSDGPVVILAQSLGCQVTSCYFWDAQQSVDGKVAQVGIWRDFVAFEKEIAGEQVPLTLGEKEFLRGASFKTFITTGCNIPIFVAAHARRDIKPIEPNGGDAFAWHNFYDKDDVLGWPLSDLSSEYAKVVTDHPINASRSLWEWLIKSWNPLSHSQYWGDGKVLDVLEQHLRTVLSK